MTHDITCHHATSLVITRRHLSSRDVTYHHETSFVITRRHFSSRDVTCHHATSLVTRRRHQSRRDVICHHATRPPHALPNPWKSPGQFSLRATRSEPVQAKKASPSKGSESRVKMLTESDLRRSWVLGSWVLGSWGLGSWGLGSWVRGRRGGSSPSSSSAMDAGAAKSSSNSERGDTESESKRKRAAGESLLPDSGDAVDSSASNTNLQRVSYLMFTTQLLCQSTTCLVVVLFKLCLIPGCYKTKTTVHFAGVI